MRNWLRSAFGGAVLGGAVLDEGPGRVTLDAGPVVMATRPHFADFWMDYERSPYNYQWGDDARREAAGAREQYAAALAAVRDGRGDDVFPTWLPSTDRTKVCIVGAGLYKDEAAPILADPAWEVWAINLCPPLDAAGRLRADVWFDLHQRCAQSADDLRWIAACPFPIYVPPDLHDASPMAWPFPLGLIEAEFGSYFSCTFAYQVALALWMRKNGRPITDLALYGVELAYGPKRERTVEWACTAYWIGRAEEAGLQIHLPQKSTVARHFGRYGFEYEHERDAVLEYVKYMDRSDAARKLLGEDGGIGG